MDGAGNDKHGASTTASASNSKNNAKTSGGTTSSSSATTSCGVFEIVIFVVAIVTGTACSICSKTMMSLHAVGQTGDVELFSKPLFQTFGAWRGVAWCGVAAIWLDCCWRVAFNENSTSNKKDVL